MKTEKTAFFVFKRLLASVMAFVMNRNFLFFVSALVLIALAACGKGEEEKVPESQATGAAVSQPAAPEVVPAPATGTDIVTTLREKSGIMTPEEKAAAIERARDNARAAALAVGQSEQQAQAAGEAAASAAQRSLDGLQPAE